MTNIIQSLDKEFNYCYEFRIAFIGYRDLEDREQFVIENFTTDVAKVSKKIKETKATGGKDYCEDIVGALT